MPDPFAEEVRQEQADLQLPLLRVCGSHGQADLQGLVPGEDIARLAGCQPQFDRLAGGETRLGIGCRKLHGIQPNGRSSRWVGIVFGRPEIGTRQDVASLGRGREVELIALPIGRQFDQLVEGGGANCRTTSRAGVSGWAAFMAAENVYFRPGLTAIQPTLAASGAVIGQRCVCR